MTSRNMAMVTYTKTAWKVKLKFRIQIRQPTFLKDFSKKIKSKVLGTCFQLKQEITTFVGGNQTENLVQEGNSQPPIILSSRVTSIKGYLMVRDYFLMHSQAQCLWEPGARASLKGKERSWRRVESSQRILLTKSQERLRQWGRVREAAVSKTSRRHSGCQRSIVD
jgi:hypothetical protein